MSGSGVSPIPDRRPMLNAERMATSKNPSRRHSFRHPRHASFVVSEECHPALRESECTRVDRILGWINHPDTGWDRPMAEFHREPSTTDERQPS